MAKQQDQEWIEAQKIVISTNLVAAAKKHLKFLEVVDSNGYLYDGLILEKAIFRYKYCWLPLFASHTETKHPECQLVVPLDCEWIWHCHRLNPVRYVTDCKKLFGRILDPDYVAVSSIEGACKRQTQEIWKKHYPEEPYELDFSYHLKNDTKSKVATLPSTTYDLTSAVKRQSSFYHKVTTSTITDDVHLEGAVERYRGFLHLVRRNMEMNLKTACVPTRDIDLMWHTHQLHPLSYCKDCLALVGQLLHHDDSDSDQSKGGKLDVGITTTTKQWGEMFGSWYWGIGSKCNSIAENVEGDKLAAKCKSSVVNTEVEKLAAKCKSSVEKLSARCWCIAEHMEGEKLFAKCKSSVENTKGETLAAKCKSSVEKLSARCWCIAEHMDEEKMTAKCRSIVKGIEGEKVDARCWCISEKLDTEKLSAKCRSIVEGAEGEMMAARCWCIAEKAPQSSNMVFVTAGGGGGNGI